MSKRADEYCRTLQSWGARHWHDAMQPTVLRYVRTMSKTRRKGHRKPPRPQPYA